MDAPPPGARSQGPPKRESRIVRGWRITRTAWRLIRADGAMLSLALLGMLFAAIATILVAFFGGWLTPSAGDRLPPALIGLIVLFPWVFVGTFFNAAVAVAASAAFDGEPMSVGEALRIARAKLAPIAVWSIVSALVGVIVSEVAERLPGGSALFARLLGAAWGLATFLVVPILAIEGAGALPAISRSAKLMKSRWGEGLTGSIAIGAWTVLITVPGVMLFVIGLAAAPEHPAAGVPMLVLGLTAVVMAAGYAAAARQVFAVALYRYAIDAPVGGFSDWDLARPFDSNKQKKRRRTASVLRVTGAVVIGLVVLSVVVAVIAGSNRRTAEDGYFNLVYDQRYASSFSPGMPVVADGRRIGAVYGTEVEGGRVTVDFRVAPRYTGFVQANGAWVVRWHGRHVIRIGPGPDPARPGSGRVGR